MWLTLLALRNAIAVLMASLAMVVLGATSLDRMSIDLFPNINQPLINIGTAYTGANVQDIEKTVTYPIEKAVSAVANVRHVESRSRQGISVVQVWFNYDADLNAGQNEIIQRIQQIINTLPSGVKQPFIVRFDLSNIPVCLITVRGGGLDEKQLYDVAFNVVEPQIDIERVVDRGEQLVDLPPTRRRSVRAALVRRIGGADQPVIGPRDEEHHLAGDPDRQSRRCWDPLTGHD